MVRGDDLLRREFAIDETVQSELGITCLSSYRGMVGRL